MVEFHEQKWKKYLEGTKLLSVPFYQWQQKNIFGDYFFPVSPVTKYITWLELLIELFPGPKVNLIFKFIDADLRKKIFTETTRWEMMKLFGVLILIAC